MWGDVPSPIEARARRRNLPAKPQREARAFPSPNEAPRSPRANRYRPISGGNGAKSVGNGAKTAPIGGTTRHSITVLVFRIIPGMNLS
ncbi:hypothetical protein BHE74_00052942 [Ensete ventricosum]|nr:hypothetical protein BHE74_00052942 [Ensete ventricosum]